MANNTKKLSIRRAIFARTFIVIRNIKNELRNEARELSLQLQEEDMKQLKGMPEYKGYDPELLFVECGRCGAPVIWEEGRATELLRKAGIDPLELDSSCILITDACPACGSRDEYSVRIFRIASPADAGRAPIFGHA